MSKGQQYCCGIPYSQRSTQVWLLSCTVTSGNTAILACSTISCTAGSLHPYKPVSADCECAHTLGTIACSNSSSSATPAAAAGHIVNNCAGVEQSAAELDPVWPGKQVRSYSASGCAQLCLLRSD